MLTDKELQALKYQGLLGHEFIVLRANLNGCAKCDSLKSARESLKELAPNGHIYQQVSRQKFKKIQ